jgi:hypothetical protein
MRTAALLVLVVLSRSLILCSPAAADDLPGAKEVKGCLKVPAGKRAIKLNIKPDSEVADLIRWMSTITCTSFLFSGDAVQGKKVTVHSPELLTPEEAYQLFVGALASVDLTLEPVANAGREAKVIKIVKKPPSR